MTRPLPSDGLARLLGRRSVSPRRLGAPGPSDDAVATAIAAGLRAPDHGGLVPWRAVLVPSAGRPTLARLFTEEKRRRDPLASPDDLARASAHATDAPTLLAFVVAPRAAATVPVHEQWLAAGAALMNLLNAFDAMGFGAIMLSGDRCADRVLAARLGLTPAEVLAGFLSIGTVVEAPSAAKAKAIDRVLSVWQGVPASADRSGAANPAVG